MILVRGSSRHTTSSTAAPQGAPTTVSRSRRLTALLTAALASLAVLSTPVLTGQAVAADPVPAPTIRGIELACPAGFDRLETTYPFADVDLGNSHYRAIYCVTHWQIANGVSQQYYAPSATVTRAQMATFLGRLIIQGGGRLPSTEERHFTDSGGGVHGDYIERLAAVGVVQGRSPGVYDPNSPVTRAQMATFLARTYDHTVGTMRDPLAEGPNVFTDTDGHVMSREINKVAAAGFAGGFADGSYQPAELVRRDQMASFLARVMDRLVEEGRARYRP